MEVKKCCIQHKYTKICIILFRVQSWDFVAILIWYGTKHASYCKLADVSWMLLNSFSVLELAFQFGFLHPCNFCLSPSISFNLCIWQQLLDERVQIPGGTGRCWIRPGPKGVGLGYRTSHTPWSTISATLKEDSSSVFATIVVFAIYPSPSITITYHHPFLLPPFYLSGPTQLEGHGRNE